MGAWGAWYLGMSEIPGSSSLPRTASPRPTRSPDWCGRSTTGALGRDVRAQRPTNAPGGRPKPTAHPCLGAASLAGVYRRHGGSHHPEPCRRHGPQRVSGLGGVRLDLRVSGRVRAVSQQLLRQVAVLPGRHHPLLRAVCARIPVRLRAPVLPGRGHRLRQRRHHRICASGTGCSDPADSHGDAYPGRGARARRAHLGPGPARAVEPAIGPSFESPSESISESISEAMRTARDARRSACTSPPCPRRGVAALSWRRARL